MSKKKSKKMRKLMEPLTISSEEVTQSQMPKFNGYAVGHGAHGDQRYNRAQNRKRFQKQIQEDM